MAQKNNEGSRKERLGLWIDRSEGAKFWLSILNDLKNRGVQEISLATVAGLWGFTEVIASVFPKTEARLCIFHIDRNFLKYIPF
jgi:putative transposase